MKKNSKKQLPEQELTKDTQSGLWLPSKIPLPDKKIFRLKYKLIKYPRNSEKAPGSNLAAICEHKRLGSGNFGQVYPLRALSLPNNGESKPRVVKIVTLTGEKAPEGAQEGAISLANKHESDGLPAGPRDWLVENEYKFTKLASHLGVKEPVYTESHAYLVMKKIEGKTLLQLKNDGTLHGLKREQKIQLILAILKALQEQVHKKNIVHGDISPLNIMVKFKPQITVNIIDYGLASDASDVNFTWARGNPMFTAPEVFELRKATQKSDLFAMARALVYVFEWNKEASSYSDKIKACYQCSLLAAGGISIPKIPELETFFQKMLSVDPEDRFSTVQAIDSIEGNFTNSSSKAEASSSSSRHGLFNRSKKGKGPAEIQENTDYQARLK